jgi:ribosomal protection tetracycline resistance protein
VRTLNLGILAPVDAGKTTLTERLLFAAGVIDEIGSVDQGSTQTDSLALERQRGITIKSAVVSFVIDDVTVNLIDTPGHPDFIAEVERVLGVLDGAVLVVSAVEGVQAQTRVLMRTLQRLRLPTLIFVNKIDRGGATHEHTLHSIAERLSPAIVAMGSTRDLGTRDADFTPHGAAAEPFTTALTSVLADHDDSLLADYVDNDMSVSYCRLRAELAAQTRRAVVHPVFFGSAITGAGVDTLVAGITELLPATHGDANRPVAGRIFKVERGPAGEKIAFVRLFSGTVHLRDRLPTGRGSSAKVTAIRVFERGAAVQQTSVAAGQIGKVWGLGDVQIGDTIGLAEPSVEQHYFAPPTLETVVVPRRPAEKGALHVALAQLAEQDPLINLRQDDLRQELFLSLYGEVQKEVIQDTLATDFNLDVEFRETTMICVERPVGTGAAVELLGESANPFVAGVGMRIDPAPTDSGVQLRLDVKLSSVPLYVYKAVDEFRTALEDTVRDTLQQGIYGWRVTDCLVTLTHSDYAPPVSTAKDFRLLTPLVVMTALQRAGTIVCEPIHSYHLDVPADTIALLVPLLARLAAAPRTTMMRGASGTLAGEIQATRVLELQQRVPGLTRGEGVLESAFDHYRPVGGRFPVRPRSDLNPLNRKEYLLHLARRV